MNVKLIGDIIPNEQIIDYVLTLNLEQRTLELMNQETEE